MEPTLNYVQSIISYGIHQPVFIGDPAAPATSKISFQWLRLSNAFKRRSHSIFNEIIDALENLFVLLLPV